MKPIGCLLLVGFWLSGCGCLPGEGDSTNPGDYMAGCWKEASRNRK